MPIIYTKEQVEALFCDHTDMEECHAGCEHFSCSCGIVWDEGAEGHFFDPEPEDYSCSNCGGEYHDLLEHCPRCGGC